jgi:hypothetical protein
MCRSSRLERDSRTAGRPVDMVLRNQIHGFLCSTTVSNRSACLLSPSSYLRQCPSCMFMLHMSGGRYLICALVAGVGQLDL